MPCPAILKVVSRDALDDAQKALFATLTPLRRIASLEEQLGGFDALDRMVTRARLNGERPEGTHARALASSSSTRASTEVIATNYPRVAQHCRLVRDEGTNSRVTSRTLALVEHSACQRMAAAADCLSSADLLHAHAWKDSEEARETARLAETRLDCAVQCLFPPKGPFSGNGGKRPPYARDKAAFQAFASVSPIEVALRGMGSRFPHGGCTVAVPRQADLLHTRDVYILPTQPPRADVEEGQSDGGWRDAGAHAASTAVLPGVATLAGFVQTHLHLGRAHAKEADSAPNVKWKKRRIGERVA
jgi:hypothetical protein